MRTPQSWEHGCYPSRRQIATKKHLHDVPSLPPDLYHSRLH
jgi:hypothetical protein